ncbi:hypothetical protein SAMN05216210_0136 [Halopseudomonas salegens]|uniref:Uncharacterized protein n=1 Tax=Halopseudomonas salegens TaxID=1434072 RepID=A0A1H2DZH4_9GAMM|nr:hypothetical protein SAMN05216210_0136 [Halopseudomonas salegens]
MSGLFESKDGILNRGSELSAVIQRFWIKPAAQRSLTTVGGITDKLKIVPLKSLPHLIQHGPVVAVQHHSYHSTHPAYP